MSYPAGTIAVMSEIRPPLSAALTGAELRRWYWTRQELTALARELDVPRGGGKQALTDRLAAALDGTPAPPPPGSRTSGRQLRAPVTNQTLIPAGQRCSQVLREHFRREIGPAFTFDTFMRTFIAHGDGRRLGEAVAHWHATRGAAGRPRPIGAQFELNTFLRRWRRDHPHGSREDALAAWRHHRALPIEARPTAAVEDEEEGRTAPDEGVVDHLPRTRRAGPAPPVDPAGHGAPDQASRRDSGPREPEQTPAQPLGAPALR
jgi:hypothetical protein